MIYELKIRLTSQMLGDIAGHDRIRRFERCRGSSDLRPDAKLWRWAISEAAESLRLNVTPNTVMIPPGIRAPRLDLYKRHYRKEGKRKVAQFESINIGAVLTLYLQVNSGDPKKKNVTAPDRVQLDQLFTFIGKFIGLSPWGRTLDFGRFTVDGVRALDTEDEIPTDFYHR